MTDNTTDWWEEAMRWGQINIREFEPAEFDIDRWEQRWAEMELDGLTLNAGGVWAYYPTELEDQHRSRWLGERDLFGELVEAAKRSDLRVLARIDPSLSHQDVYYRHPDWFALDEHGDVRIEPLGDNMDEQLYVTCLNGPYYWEHIPAVIEELHDRYEIDGIFGSEWDGRRLICHCPRCREMFQDATGLDMPEDPDPTDETWKHWYNWHEDRLVEIWQYWDGVIKDQNPNNFWMGNHSDKGFLADYAEMINVDHQARSGHDPLWEVGEQGKKMRAITRGEKSYYHIFSSNYYSRHMTKPAAECRLFIADAVLADSKPWFTIIGGVQHDQRQFNAITEMYQWHAEHEAHLRDRDSLANVAVAFSEREGFINGEYFDATTSTRNIGTAFRGVYDALLRERIAFDLVHAGRMDERALAGYDVLVLPDVGALADHEAADVRRFVENGGNLVATHETGCYDELGEPRDEGIIDDVLGVEHRWPSIGPLDHAYMSFESSDLSHPVFDGIENTDRTLFGNNLSPVETTADVDASQLTLVPPYPGYPPEASFSRIGKVDRPLLVLRDDDQGRVAYWPGDICRFYHESNAPDHRAMLANSVRWAVGNTLPARVEGRGLLEVHPYRRGLDLQVHVVNHTNQDAWKPPITEIVPVGEQAVRIRVPESMVAPEQARGLVSGEELPVEADGDWVATSLPEIRDHEVVVFEGGDR